jgi:predicted MFS family arabinose efflux permease
MGAMSRWSMLALIVIARVSMGLQFQSIAPVAPLLIADFALSYSQLGLLIGLYLLPGAVIALPGGMLGQRFGNSRVALWALGFMVGGGLATAASHSFWFVCVGRIISGVGAVLLTLIVSKMTAEWFRGKELSTAMGLMLAGWPLGIGLGVAFFAAVAATSTWRFVQYLVSASTALSLLLFSVFYRDPPGVSGSGGPLSFWPSLRAREWALALAAGMVWMLFNVSFIVFVSFGPGLLVWRGASLAEAGVLMSVAVWMSIVSVPLGGALVDRTGRPNSTIAFGGLLTALTMLAVSLLSNTLAWLLVGGLMAGLAPGAIVALLPKSLKSEHLAAALGLFYAINYLGMAAMQPVAGLLRDLTGSPAAPIFFAAAMMALTAVALGVFRWVDGRVPTRVADATEPASAGRAAP